MWRIWPLGQLVHQFMNAFTDHRDSDLLIVRYACYFPCSWNLWSICLIHTVFNSSFFMLSAFLAISLSYWVAHFQFGCLLDSMIDHLPLLPEFWVLELEIQWWVCLLPCIIMFFFFFFLISKNDIYTKGYSMQEKHRANSKITRRKQRKNIKENQKIC